MLLQHDVFSSCLCGPGVNGWFFTSITFFPGCSAAISFSPSSFSLVMVASLDSRHLLMKFCWGGTDELCKPDCNRCSFHKCALRISPLSHLILLLPGGVVQVGIAPVIVDSLLSLLVHPVELVGAVLHVVPQAQQVALTSGGIGLTKGNGRATTIFFWWFNDLHVPEASERHKQNIQTVNLNQNFILIAN